MLMDQMNIMADGGEPTINIFRDEAENRGLEAPVIPQEQFHWGGGGGRPPAAEAVPAARNQRGGFEMPSNLDRIRDETGAIRTEPALYIPGEAGYSADAEKIEATRRTWDGFDRDRARALQQGRERVDTGA
jgi:hypothetical protein